MILQSMAHRVLPSFAQPSFSRLVKSQFHTLVKQSTEITSADIQALSQNRLAFLVIPSFVPLLTAERVSYKILTEKEVEEYRNAQGVVKVADQMALFETTGSVEEKKRYFANAALWNRQVRELFAPEISPLDKLIGMLSKNTGRPAEFLQADEGSCFAGLIRVLNKGALAHEDKLERDMKELSLKTRYCSQLAFNVYLQMPLQGGDICVWDRSMETEEYNKAIGDSYGIDPEKLGPPSASYRPKAGEGIFFNPRNLHAVKKCDDQWKQRITISCFVGQFLTTREEEVSRIWS